MHKGLKCVSVVAGLIFATFPAAVGAAQQTATAPVAFRVTDPSGANVAHVPMR